MINSISKTFKPYLLLLPFCAGVFLGADDQTKVVTILPQIMIDFEIPITSLDTASWLITIYLMTNSTALIQQAPTDHIKFYKEGNGSNQSTYS